MRAFHSELEISTSGHGDVIDLTSAVNSWIVEIAGHSGVATVFVPGATAAVTTIEYEPGALKDLDEALETLAPSTRAYHHDRRWGDGNGFSHLRAALLGPSLSVPVVNGRCCLGTWQQIVVVECDRIARARRVLLAFVGEGGEP
jgi:secondary thiamine-phosphate synthase enzyme